MKSPRAHCLKANLSTNLKTARRLAGLTQAGLSEVTGLHLMTIQHIERQLHASTLDTLEIIAGALALPPPLLIESPAEATALLTQLMQVNPPLKVPRSSRGRVV